MEQLMRLTPEAMTLGVFHLNATSLVVQGQPTFPEWESCGVVLRRMEGAVQWWIGDWLNYGEKAYGDKYTTALAATEYDDGTLRNYASVAGQIEMSRRRDILSFSIHTEIAALPAHEQDAWLDRAEAEHLTRAQLRDAIRVARRQKTLAAVFPDGPFRVVYADPPWAYRDSGVITTKGGYGRAERHYPTMELDDIAALPVRSRVLDDAVLFLWVTSPLLGECWSVVEAWGFEYKASIVWDKVAHNYGHYVAVQHELLLICTRGSCLPDQPTPMPDSVISIPRSDRHSEKPPAFRDLIDRLYPEGPALELFGRKAVSGRWRVYGNQLEASA